MSYTTDTALTAAHAEVKAEISRTDTKISLLLAFDGAILAGAWSVASGTHLSTAAQVIGAMGVAVLIGAAVVLLRAARPNLSGGPRNPRPVGGFPLWAQMTPGELTDFMETDGRARDIVALSGIAVAKYKHLRRSIDWTLAGGALLLVAGVLAWVGAA
ncbi:DUF5706 domain-containing protein [Streptomyces sp. NBC_01525]|uniref:Pycsar system effector family protein n=1 Tax=Streptomyces sp. NBC_01525 TaxID=2903893 RepID=UPI003868BD93